MIDELEKLRTNIAPLPWTACGYERGGCQCCTVMTRDYPVCSVTEVKWGDRYPNIRLIDDSIGGFKAEAFMDGMDYGEVPIDQAKATIYIASVVNSVPLLIAEIKRLKRDN